VRDYYASFAEHERLTRDEGVVEWVVNTHFLEEYLPPEGRVLDLGGGTGRYTEWLATQGHEVVLADLSPDLVAIARERIDSPRVVEIVECDARELARWSDASFSAAVVLGPLYHMPDEADRNIVVDEVKRVVRPGGVAFFALMPTLTFLRRTVAIPDERRHLADETFVRDLLADGRFTNDIPGRFTHGWGVNPAEVVPWFEQHGLSTLALAASEGIASGMESAFVDLEGEASEVARRLLVETSTDPSILGAAKHLLWVGRV